MLLILYISKNALHTLALSPTIIHVDSSIPNNVMKRVSLHFHYASFLLYSLSELSCSSIKAYFDSMRTLNEFGAVFRKSRLSKLHDSSYNTLPTTIFNRHINFDYEFIVIIGLIIEYEHLSDS